MKRQDEETRQIGQTKRQDEMKRQDEEEIRSRNKVVYGSEHNYDTV